MNSKIEKVLEFSKVEHNWPNMRLRKGKQMIKTSIEVEAKGHST